MAYTEINALYDRVFNRFENEDLISKAEVLQMIANAPAAENVTEALEKQIPKEPLKKSTEYNGEYGYCPCCNSILADYTDFKRCRNCGQALKW
jgi:hypothetical protein